MIVDKSFIPNFLTFTNLSMGIISIIFCFREKTAASIMLILTAALIDRYDGKIARRFKAETLIGKELDSLADLVSFGVAPSILAWKLSLCNWGVTGYIILLVFPICGAFRLARYNLLNLKNTYMGIPITVAGSLIALDSIVVYKAGPHTGLTAIYMLLLSYLMVCSIKVKKI